MKAIANYEQQVYASVLGKIFGVYMGRPFEGWPKEKIKKKWGQIDRYVNDDLDIDLVVSDDDITGTFTFVRALKDSGVLGETSAEFFGDTWLNYLIENQTILWWAGMGISTEHTAYIRLKNGVKAPLSGSSTLNGKCMSEQIGAQIFIDGIGMCFPGDPDSAARLAIRAACVSHDGEAIYAAQIVAAMVAAAFIEKDMTALLDIGVSYIPQDSIIAQVHADVRQWCEEDKDWHKTFTRIDKKYGCHTYGGMCHVVPNHAIMVMAWAYAPDDFHEAQIIVNTAGWDTDCNAANVGAVMGLVVGLDRINERYDYQSPTADRVLMPTAEGTRGTSDALLESTYIAELGRACMGWETTQKPKEGAWLHFSQPGALHGFRAESSGAVLSNVMGDCLRIKKSMGNNILRLSKPIVSRGDSRPAKGYSLMGTPILYSGYQVTVKGRLDNKISSLKAFVRFMDVEKGEILFHSTAADNAGEFELTFDIPYCNELPVFDFGFELEGEDGEVLIDAVSYVAKPNFSIKETLPDLAGAYTKVCVAGWVSDYDFIWRKFHDDNEEKIRLAKNYGHGLLCAGTSDWENYSVSARVTIHMADYVGLIARYQGKQRHLILKRSSGKLQLAKQYYGEHILAECLLPDWNEDELHILRLDCVGNNIQAYCDDVLLFDVEDKALTNGGIGIGFANGSVGFRDLKVAPLMDFPVALNVDMKEGVSCQK